ncbi:AraC family transcriptional regulator [Pararhizobium sp. BT-229]|uniref:AraC family transcriptional regulator n=1 Tax=Pararhizobium sp. BT-229 TaxID=2986923 RepID=UPI0021F73C50|nr:AraC family transcriptional regulator [Pararhizobium sp. BT-229]MCV9966346.1 AraC family transcriptional regulator [Pararhizobium sp. BT-229]
MTYREMGSVALYFGVPEAPCLTTIPLRSAAFSVTRIRRNLEEGRGRDVFVPACDAYFLMIYLEDADHSDIRPDGSRAPIRHYKQGSICLIDLQKGASITLHSCLQSLAFVLPKELFAEIAALSPLTARYRLMCKRGVPDSVLRNLGSTVLALFDDNWNRSSPALLRHVALAICAHLLHQYGEDFSPDESKLSVVQAQLTKDLMRANPAKDPPLDAIAAATGILVAHFPDEFAEATGLMPDEWVARMRHAKELLRERRLSSTAVALLCGFSDLGEFTAAFLAETGMTPDVWRDTRRH